MFADLADHSTFTPTYAVLDAVKIPNLSELLAVSDLEHRCLVKGAEYDELRDVSPWLVRLEADHALTRHLLTSGDAPWTYWDDAPGIFVRSGASFDAVWRHFRKFSKVRDADGRWMYFRFCDPDALHAYLGHIQTNPSKIMQWFRVDTTTIIDQIIGFDSFDDLAWSVTYAADPPDTIAIAGTPIFTPEDMARLTEYRRDSFDRITALALLDSYPKLALNKKEMRDVCRTIRTWVARFGVTGARDVRRLVNLSVYLGMRYDIDPTFGPGCEHVLRDEGLKPGQKVDRIVAMAKHWLSAASQREASYGTR